MAERGSLVSPDEMTGPVRLQEAGSWIGSAGWLLEPEWEPARQAEARVLSEPVPLVVAWRAQTELGWFLEQPC